ncbi:MAG: WhiB family transcriptional regulator [Pseudonocardia sp.]|nr:WhiB family transcriptional regulator [Pseudonocardia sp.]
MTQAITDPKVDGTDERNWRDRAACRGGVDPELFFPVEEDVAACADQVAAAKAVCGRCPVRRPCLDDALTRLPYGIAGGLTAAERRRLNSVARSDREQVATHPQDWTRAGMRRSGVAALRAGCTAAEVMDLCGASRRTVYRWTALANEGSVR